MKIVIQSDSWIWGGNEKWLLLVGSGLAARNHDVLVSCKPGGEVDTRARAAGLRITHQRPGADADVYHAARFASMLRNERADALLLSAFKRSFWGGWAARRARVPRVVERMGIERTLPAKWKYRHAFRHYIDGMIVNSSVIRDRWLQSAPWYPANEVHVVLNGVRRPDPTTDGMRRELGLDAGTPLVAAAGRLEKRKGFDILLSAFAQCGVADGHLVIAGDGTDEPTLRVQADALGIAHRVHWIGFRTDLDRLLVDADVFVLASRLEGMANVMLEAMAADCLVVASDISGVREAIGEIHGRPEAGWIVPVEDARAMAAAIRDALRVRKEATARYHALLDETRHRIDSWFSPEQAIIATESILRPRPSVGI